MSSDVAVVILAGGQRAHMEGVKPLRTLAGERLIDGALNLARGYSDVIAIAVRDPSQGSGTGAELLGDDFAEGPIGGLIAALRFARQSKRGLLLTITADMPFLPCDLAEAERRFGS